MKLNLSKNWIAKVLSLLLAITIWFLIKSHLATGEMFSNNPPAPPRATIVPEYPPGTGGQGGNKR